MRKVGRNEPRPCGSGKKYKKCCIDKTPRRELWTYEEIDAMSTAEIIRQLDGFGIPLEQDLFLQAVEEYYSAQDISDNWFQTYQVTAQGKDEDFPWLAAYVLWVRLAPENNLSAEQISNLISEGWDHIYANEPLSGCDLWLEAWEAIKHKCQPENYDLDFMKKTYRAFFFIGNFYQDLINELHNAGIHNPLYFQKRIVFCKELLPLFLDEETLVIHNTRRALAESYASMDNYEQSDREFEKLVQDYPHNPWGYIGWGDSYRFSKQGGYDRAKELYLKALSIAEDKEERMVVQERLESVRE